MKLLLTEKKFSFTTLLLSFTAGISFLTFIINGSIWGIVTLISFFAVILLDVFLYEAIENNVNYCPYCGANINKVREDNSMNKK